MRRAVNKSIAIIGEGETEWFYFESLRIACRYPFKVAPDFPQHSDIGHMLKLLEAYLYKQFDLVVCLFDMDRLFQHPAEMQVYRQAKKKYSTAKYAGKVMFVETNPCTEFWFLLHFLPRAVCRKYENYEQLLPELQKYMPGYEKTQRYFKRTNLYKYLTENGDLERAIANSEKLCQMCQASPEDKMAYTEVHRVIEVLRYASS
ncbi:MAG: RloB family protein [Bacteroides sp.]|nr:RloB family protein [Ruminococcus flavefaciens]MCM1554749.1 RloB family protein [Bacteroides sp.]